jgi:hypothetical protein
MATQAGAVGLLRGTILKVDDLVLRLLRVATCLYVQASGSVTLLAVDLANRVLAATIRLGHLAVTCSALISPHFGGTLDLNVFAEILRLLGGLGLGCSE